MILLGTALGVTRSSTCRAAGGMFLLGAFVLSMRCTALVRHGPPRVIHPRWAWLAGLCGGITSTLFGAGGPAYAIYLSQRGLGKEQFRATMGFAIMTSISVRVVAFSSPLAAGERSLAHRARRGARQRFGLFIAKKLYLRISRERLMRGRGDPRAQAARFMVRALY